MKAERRRKILEIVASRKIETQQELAGELRRHGLGATQATISRDVKELGIIKVPSGSGAFHYAMARENPGGDLLARLGRMFIDVVTGIDHSENLVVIHTLPGSAHAVGSVVDHLGWKEIIGTVAGDDTVLVVVKPKSSVEQVHNQFMALLSQG